MSFSEVYRYPKYCALAYRWNTEMECDFIEACLTAHGPAGGKRLFDIGCGAGRHLLHLAKKGYRVSGIDVRPEMVAYVQQEAQRAQLPVAVATGDLRNMTARGSYDLAYCFMDTFRFLLTNEEILTHLRAVAGLLAPGGLYLTDFWVPRQWD